MLGSLLYIAVSEYQCLSFLSLCFIEEPILVFKRNAFLSLKEEKRLIAKKNSKVALNLLYCEVSTAILLQFFILSMSTVLRMAGCLFCCYRQ